MKWMCPECAAGKHRSCDGTSWDFDADVGVVCPCWAESGAQAGEHCVKTDTDS